MIHPFKNRCLNPGLKVRVHRNLHNGMFSVVQGGLVIAHAEHIVLSDCIFVVNQAGRERVLRDKRKNVHAFVAGYLAVNQGAGPFSTRVSYNPYKADSFMSDSAPVSKAFAVCINTVTGVTAESIA